MRDGETGAAPRAAEGWNKGVANVSDDVDLPSVGQMDRLKSARTSSKGVMQEFGMQGQGFDGNS